MIPRTFDRMSLSVIRLMCPFLTASTLGHGFLPLFQRLL
jgi:hypothetical protein